MGVDTWIPGKYIHQKGISVAGLFIKREADDKRLFRYTDLWYPIDCLPMEEKNLIECCDVSIPGCKTVMISKDKIPDIYTSRTGYLIQVTSVDYDRDYTITTPKGYKNTQVREFLDKRKRYCWIENGHLVIPNSMVQNVRLNAMFINRAEAMRLNCKDGDCIKLLDQPFVAPEHLLDNIKDKVTLDILRRPPPDEFPNLNENEKEKARP